MTKLIIICLTIPIFLFGQETDERKMFVFESNLPDELEFFYQQGDIMKLYSLRTDLNPFYLRGDFDGDKKLDYAISIIEKKTNKKGILIFHMRTKTHYIVGAGNFLRNKSKTDDYFWMDAWKVYTGKNVKIGIGETQKITIKGEAILVIKTESSSGLLYWTGKEYDWYQQGD